MGEPEFQTFLDSISACFIDENFSVWQENILLPFALITSKGPITLTSEAELRADFEGYLTACRVMRLDKIYRIIRRLEECPDGTWLGTYETNLMCQGSRATRPYVSTALLHQVDGGFKMSAILNARGHADWTRRPE